MPLTRTRIALGGSLIGAAALVWWITPTEHPTGPAGLVALPAASVAENAAPRPVATSPASLAATLRANNAPPSPELLRDNREAQAAYDASARPGDYVTPPNVSVEH